MITKQIELGNIRYWRLGRFLCLVVIIIIEIIIAIFLDVVDLTALAICGLVIMIFIEQSKYFKRIYSTKYSIVNGNFTIDNSYIHIACSITDIENLQLKEIRYGGRFLDIIGWRLMFSVKGKKYHVDSKILDTTDNAVTILYQELVKSGSKVSLYSGNKGLEV